MTPVGTRAEFGVEFTAKGLEAILASFKRIEAQVKGVTRETKGAGRAGTELGRSFRNIALRTVAIIGLVRSFRLVTNAFREATAAGIEYNETIEQSRLAIASLISAQGDLTTSTGEQIQGVEKLDAAYGLAVDQVRKLRIAGIQTAATTKELVDAFQQAVGAGLATGLTLDEIRVVTIRIAQAAGALGVPYRQLNEEIRSILGGIIDQNTRIAKALGITNEQVKLAKEQGRLAEFLLDQFEAFGVAGDRIVETWAALKSNVKETLELFSGEVTFPAFEAVRTRGLDAVQRIFDFDTAEISKEFAEIVRTLRLVFAGVGDSIAGAFEGALDTAVRLNGWLERNRDTVGEVVFQMGELVNGVSTLIGGVTRIGLGFTKWATETGIVAQLMETIADVMKDIGNSRLLSGGLFLGIGGGIVALLAAVFGGTAVAVGGLVASLTLLVSQLDAASESTWEAADAQRRLNDENTQALVGTTNLARNAKALAEEYDELNRQLKENEVETSKVADAEARLLSLRNQLKDISPIYARAVDQATESEEDYAEAIEEAIRLEKQRITEEKIALRFTEARANARLREIERIRQAEEAANRGRGAASRPFADVIGDFFRRQALSKEENALNKLLEDAAENAAILNAELAEIDRLILGQDFTLTGPDQEDAANKLKALRAEIELEIARIKAALKSEEVDLKASFDRNQIGYVEYWGTLTAIQEAAIEEQIALYQRLAEAEDKDPQKRGAALQKIEALEAELHAKRTQNQTQLLNAELKFSNEVAKIQQRIFEVTGQEAEATTLKLENQYRELLTNLAAMGDGAEDDIALVRRLIDLEEARARFDRLQEEYARFQDEIKRRTDAIQLQEQIGAIRPDQAQLLLADEYEKLYQVIDRLLPEMAALADEVGDPDMVANVQDLTAEMERLGVEIGVMRDEWKEFRDQVASGAEDALARHLSSAVIEADNLGQAFTNLGGSIDSLRNLLGSLVQVIVEVTARMIALRIVQAALGSFAGGGSVGGGETVGPGGYRSGYASGGPIQGPGSSTSDSIIARLSAGEYVIRASSVRKYGTGFLHALNAGALPRQVTNLRRYASGGMVGVSASTPSQELRGEMTIGLEEGLVVEHMATPAGERLVLNIIQKNRRGIRRGLGI